MSEDPWNGLAPPNAAHAVTARRVDAGMSWDFFWAVDLDRRYLLLLQHGADSQPQGHLPRLNGIELAVHPSSEGKPALLTFRLLDSAYRDVFQRLCRDIVDGAAAATTEKEAVAVALARTWRWHYLLRGGGDGRLTAAEQKGLIGELLTLERLLLPGLSAGDAVAAWGGPLGAPKDFEVGRIAIEAKARRGGAAPYVTINSEHQLDTAGVDALFLHVVEVTRAPSEPESGLPVTGVARRIRNLVEERDPGAVERYDSLLLSAGLRWDDDYSDTMWMEGPGRLYRVDGTFPRLTAAGIPTGVSGVRYAVSLNECEVCLVSEADLQETLDQAADVH